MKVFIWNRPRGVPYGSTILYVVAEDEFLARKEALSAILATYGTLDNPLVVERFDSLPEPTRVIDLADTGGAYAEVYEWSE